MKRRIKRKRLKMALSNPFIRQWIVEDTKRRVSSLVSRAEQCAEELRKETVIH